MNAFATFSGLILMCMVRELVAVCPTDRENIGSCIGTQCPPGNYCSAKKDGDCCSGVAPPCVDILSDCAKNVALCNVNSYRVFMTNNCPKTCDRCGVECADANNLCPQWAAQGFCESSFYTTVQKQAYCLATCGYC
uniref:ShKT domain-containing protein n=1 Tax=Plectus sambesii TaxID=2011161 RepID=A0A914UMG1_9BILA